MEHCLWVNGLQAQFNTQIPSNGLSPEVKYRMGRDIDGAILKCVMLDQRNEVRSGLLQLPSPQNEYQIVVPQMPEEAEKEDVSEEDAAEAKVRTMRHVQYIGTPWQKLHCACMQAMVLVLTELSSKNVVVDEIT